MKVMQLAILGVALSAAGGAFFVGNNLVNQQPEIREVEVAVDNGPRIELTEILVASRDISLGTSLQQSMLTWQQWPKEGMAKGYITRENTPDGLNLSEEPAIARSAFFVGEPIRKSKLVYSSNGYMSAILPAGQQAVATSISTATSAGGFILPNDRVDVIMIRRSNDNSIEGGFITETVLENVRILAIDQTVEEQDGEPVVVGETATLQLSPDQAKILTVAQQMAERLTLALRSLEDIGNEETTGANYLLSGNKGNGRVRIIKYGNRKEVISESMDGVH